MNGYYEKKIKQYNEQKRLIREEINKTTKRALIFLDTLLLALVVQLGVLLATNENIIMPEQNQYLEFRAVEVREVEGQNKQVIMELWANNLELKGFDIHFSYDATKLQPSILQTNEITGKETEYFQFEQEFKDVLELFTVPTGKEGEIRGVVTFNPPVNETEHIIEKAGIGKVIDSQGSVLLGKISFQMKAEEFDISWFNVIKDESKTGIKISQDGKKYYEAETTLRFTDYKVAPNEVKEIEMGKMPKTEYKYGELLNVAEGTIIITRNNGETEEININPNMILKYNPNELGEQKITIEYEGKTTTYIINIEDYIKDIEIQKPTKLIYNVGEEKDLTGGTVTSIMASGAKAQTVEMADASVQVEGFDTTVKGAKILTVTYEGITKGIGITVVEETDEVQLKELPVKTEYLYGEEIDVTGGELEITNEDGEKEIIEITKEMITGYDPEKVGEQKVTIKYEEFEVEYIVSVEDYEVGLKIEKPTKIEYEYGEKIDLSNGTVSIVMASGAEVEKIELMNYMISGYEKEKVGQQTIEVEYRGQKGNFEVTVIDKIKGIAIYSEPNKTQYKYGENIDISGATIRVIKSSGTTIIPITNNMISGYNPTICGTQVITITYGEFTTQFIVNVDKYTEKPDENKPNENNPSTNNNGNTNNNTDNSTSGNGQNINQTPVENQGAEENNPDKPITDEPILDEPTQDKPLQEPEEKPTETLGEKDKRESNIQTKKVVAIIAGIIVGISGLSIGVLLILNRKNVKVYVAINNKYELIGKDRISSKQIEFSIDSYLTDNTYQNEVKIEINKSTSKKLDGKEIEITHRNQKIKREINYEDKSYEIYLK